MKKYLLALIIMAFATASYAATTVDVFIDFEGGTNGSQLTAAALTSSKHGSGGSFSVESSDMTGNIFSTSASVNSSRTVTVGGTTYTLGGSLGYSVDGGLEGSAQKHFAYTLATGHKDIAIGFHWVPGDCAAGDPYGSWNNVGIYSAGGYYGFMDINGWTSPGYHLVIEENSGTGSTIAYTVGKLYWVSMVYSGTNYTVTIYLYDGTTYALVGSSTHSLGASQNAYQVWMGRTDHHPGHSSGTYTYFDNLVVKYDTTSPIIPAEGGGTTYVVSATAGTGGSVSPTSQSVSSGSTTTVTVTANSGYDIDSVTGCGGSLIGTTYTTGAITGNCTVTAVFNPLTAYYVDKDSIGGTCNDTNSGAITTPWCTITKANTTLVAGKKVYIREGTYTTSYINPSNSGSAGSLIEYEAYSGEDVIISGTAYGVLINGKSYIKVSGIDVTGTTTMGMYITNGAHNEVAYCSFTNNSTSQYTANDIQTTAQYNWIHGNYFAGNWVCNGNFGEVLQVGTESTSATDQSYYNLIEDNTFAYAGHHVVGIKSKFNTIRNNFFHNEIVGSNAGGRNLYFNGALNYSGWNLVEGNRFGYSGQPCAYDVVGSVAMSTPSNIVRYNAGYYNNSYWIGFSQYTNYTTGSLNHVYNNTAYGNGKSLIKTGYAGTSQDTAVYFDTNATSATGNVLKNNLYYNHNYVHAGLTAGQTIGTNYNGDVSGSPLFVSVSYSDKTVEATPNLNLQAASPAINTGVALTTVADGDSGSGTTLVVSDAAYFQDGTWAPAGTVSADYIAVGTVSNTVQISSINYSTNTITLASGITRSFGQSVWLYKKSDGDQVLYGTAPDFGAYESTGTSSLKGHMVGGACVGCK